MQQRKKGLLAGSCICVALSSLPILASAQSSVTLYGMLDVGVQYTTRADGQHSSVNLQNYGNIPTIFGLTGHEDLGGGLSAVFKLEQAFNINDGTATVPGYAFFREAYVGLSGACGIVTAGRHFSVLFDETISFDPYYFAAYSGQPEVNPLSDILVSNSIKYKSVAIGGFTFEGLASTDGVAGNTRSGRTLEIGAQYNGGPLSVGAVLRQKNGTATVTPDTSGLTEKIGVLDAAYKIGPATLLAGVERLTGDLGPSKTVVWGGGRFQPTSFVTFWTGAYQTLSNDPEIGNPTLFIAGATYLISKRTSTYLNVGYSKNSAHSSQTVYEYDVAPLNGANQLAIMAGITHAF